MKFFANTIAIHNYGYEQLEKYLNLQKNSPQIFDRYDEFLIKPGVTQLKKSKTYSWEDKIDIASFLENLPKNHFFMCGKPSDMNKKTRKVFR